MGMFRNLSLFLAILGLAGCGASASSTGVFTAEGKRGYVVNCSGGDRNWGLCYQKAGSICEDRGYEILEVTGEAGTVTAVKSATGLSTATTTTTHNRIMIMQCKPPVFVPASPEAVPSMPAVSRIVPKSTTRRDRPVDADTDVESGAGLSESSMRDQQR